MFGKWSAKMAEDTRNSRFEASSPRNEEFMSARDRNILVISNFPGKGGSKEIPMKVEYSNRRN